MVIGLIFVASKKLFLQNLNLLIQKTIEKGSKNDGERIKNQPNWLHLAREGDKCSVIKTELKKLGYS